MREIIQSGGVEVRVVYALLTLELIGRSSRYEGGGLGVLRLLVERGR